MASSMARVAMPAGIILAALLALAASLAAAAIAAEGELAAWLLRAGWWAHLLLTLAVVQAVASIALGLRSLNRPLATWVWLVLPAVATLVGALGTWHGLTTGLRVLPAADLAQHAALWAAVRGEAGTALALGLLVAAQGCAGMVLGAGLAAWRNAPACPRRHRALHAASLVGLGLALALGMGALLTGSHGDADVARLAWLALWAPGLGLALVPATLGCGALVASSDVDERAAGLRLAAQAALGAVGALSLQGLALWQAHVAQAFLSLTQASYLDAAAILGGVVAALQRTLLSSTGSALAALLLALGLLLPLLRRAWPRRRDLQGVLPAAALIAVPALLVVALAAWTRTLGPQVLQPLARRSPLSIAVPVADIDTELAPARALLTLSAHGLHVDGERANGSLAHTREALAAEPGACSTIALAAPATLRLAELRPLRDRLLQDGVCEVVLVVQRFAHEHDAPASVATSHLLSSSLQHALAQIAALRPERWGALPLRLADPPAGEDGEALAPSCRAELGSDALTLTDSDGHQQSLAVPGGSVLDARALQAHWEAARERRALSAVLRLTVDEDLPLQALVDLLAATRVRDSGEAGADPFGHDPGARERSLFEAVHWIP